MDELTCLTWLDTHHIIAHPLLGIMPGFGLIDVHYMVHAIVLKKTYSRVDNEDLEQPGFSHLLLFIVVIPNC